MESDIYQSVSGESSPSLESSRVHFTTGDSISEVGDIQIELFSGANSIHDLKRANSAEILNESSEIDSIASVEEMRRARSLDEILLIPMDEEISKKCLEKRKKILKSFKNEIGNTDERKNDDEVKNNSERNNHYPGHNDKTLNFENHNTNTNLLTKNINRNNVINKHNTTIETDNFIAKVKSANSNHVILENCNNNDIVNENNDHNKFHYLNNACDDLSSSITSGGMLQCITLESIPEEESEESTVIPMCSTHVDKSTSSPSECKNVLSTQKDLSNTLKIRRGIRRKRLMSKREKLERFFRKVSRLFAEAKPSVSTPLIALIVFLNCVAPGVGTLLAAIAILTGASTVAAANPSTTDKLKFFAVILLTSLLQMITFFLIIGWLWSIKWAMSLQPKNKKCDGEILVASCGIRRKVTFKDSYGYYH